MAELDYTPSLPEVERKVSDDGGVLVYPAPPAPGTRNGVRLWDVVEESWTNLLPQDGVRNYLKKLSYKCSACVYVDAKSFRGVTSHISLYQRQIALHQKADAERIEDSTGVSYICTCGEYSNIRKSKVEDHILEWLERDVHSHDEATWIYLNKFVLAPPVMNIPA